MQKRHLHKGINIGDDAATSCNNLVIFGAVTPEITFHIVCTFVWLLVENRPTTAIGRAGISRRVVGLKCRWAFKAGMYMYILHKFGMLLSSSYAVNAVQLGLIHICPPGGSTFVWLYYLLGSETAMPGGLYARLCHAFLDLSVDVRCWRLF